MPVITETLAPSTPTLVPTVVPTPVVTETLANSIYLLQGLWYHPRYSGLTMSINGDGSSSNLTYSVYEMAGFYLVNQGTAKFEDGKFTYLTDKYLCTNSPQAIYEIYIIKQDGFITGMRQKLVGTDACTERMEANNSDVYYYSGMAAMPEGTERPPKTGGELMGLWFNQYELLMNFTLGHIDVNTGNADFNIMLYDPAVDPWYEAGTETARYENGKLTWLTSESACVGAAEATYEIAMIVLNDKVIAMRPTVVGDDPCKDRKENFNNRIIRRVNLP
jgi:hypothetical protein